MKKLILVLCFLIANIGFSIQSQTQILNNAFMQSPIVTILADGQSVTSAWVAVGDVFETKGVNTLGLWIAKTINNSSNLRFRIAGSMTSAGLSYLTHKETISAGVGTIADHYIELADDDSNNAMIKFDLNRIYPYVQLFVQAGTVGATAANIETIYVTKGR